MECTIEELRRRFADDAFLRWQAPGRLGDAGGAVMSNAAWAIRDLGAGPSPAPRLIVAGGPGAAAQLLTDLLAQPDQVGRRWRVSIPAAAHALLAPSLRPVGGDLWDWFVTTAAPAGMPGEEAVHVLGQGGRLTGTAAADEVAVLLAAHSPRASADPHTDADACWWGVRDGDGSLAGTIAVDRLESGAAHLRALAVAGHARGRGLGAALTAAVVRSALAAGAPAVTLGMYADNHTARRLYRRLGLTDSHHWSSGHIGAVTGQPGTATPGPIGGQPARLP